MAKRIQIRRAYAEIVNDTFGKQIKVDCTVVYPVRSGSDTILRKMIVKYVRPDCIKGFSSNGRLITLKNVSHCAVLEYAPDPRLPINKP